jgi:hypothetical protein
VRAHITQNLKPKTRVVYGHMAFYGLHELAAWPVQPRYVAFLRDPVERVISLYYYLRDKSANHWHQELAEAQWSIEGWLENSRALWHHNGQVRQLLIGSDDSVSTDRTLSRAHLEAAKHHLRDFWFVGLTETFQKDAFYLFNKLGLRKYQTDERVNANPDKPPVAAETRRAIARDNALDLELYAYAQTLRAEWLRTHWAEYQANLTLAQLRRFIYRHRSEPKGGQEQAGPAEQR